MIDLHTHSLLSDGELLPSELVARAVKKGYRAIAITDHVDTSNFEWVIKNVVRVCGVLNKSQKVKVIPGAEVTYVAPDLLAGFVKEVRAMGAKIIVVHGETIVESVFPGTNRRAIEAGVDILAHPGLISLEDAQLASRNNVYLEISTRKGHCYTNGHVLSMARQAGAKLVLDTDTHQPGDLVTIEKAGAIARGAGLTEEEIKTMRVDTEELIKKIERRQV
ncbi:MAG: histidinol phosphate phosphatase domain-containing protein [Candidatus Ratteibacteria bacterium]|nr:histidinol phosphate phosphatase domain-containing protein [Candidatus Ratteibacteria bacterium]